jgi:hypothetical protein
VHGRKWNETSGSAVSTKPQHDRGTGSCGSDWLNIRESEMTSETQIHTIARQMLERHGLGAIAQAARNALACESKGDAEEANEWRHIEDAMKMMRGPHQS